MQLFMDIVFVIAVGYYSYQYILSLARMKKKIIFPAADEERAAIRKYPLKPLDFPANPKRKTGIIIYSFVLLVITAFFIIGKITKSVDWTFYPLLLLPLINGENLLNIFSVQEDGILDGGRFVRWSRMSKYQFIPIDLNHKFYGYTDEVNAGYELKIKTKGSSVSCIVTSNEMREKLDLLLSEHIQQT
ncbi:hypothetical protein [Bacillus benzoevorans]|uniref:DUF5673 domain-containing protein n=1 Tax=Bacillus benzoevorans TaxID=1456 RepID=A0A7X0HW71_9BACI|nr:hypothetical protein [Bacillus benzoevorans]MBB6447963.1 hypothetical protein [Bacillus benzoevorans]